MLATITRNVVAASHRILDKTTNIGRVVAAAAGREVNKLNSAQRVVLGINWRLKEKDTRTYRVVLAILRRLITTGQGVVIPPNDAFRLTSYTIAMKMRPYKWDAKSCSMFIGGAGEGEIELWYVSGKYMLRVAHSQTHVVMMELERPLDADMDVVIRVRGGTGQVDCSINGANMVETERNWDSRAAIWLRYVSGYAVRAQNISVHLREFIIYGSVMPQGYVQRVLANLP